MVSFLKKRIGWGVGVDRFGGEKRGGEGRKGVIL